MIRNLLAWFERYLERRERRLALERGCRHPREAKRAMTPYEARMVDEYMEGRTAAHRLAWCRECPDCGECSTGVQSIEGDGMDAQFQLHTVHWGGAKR